MAGRWHWQDMLGRLDVRDALDQTYSNILSWFGDPALSEHTTVSSLMRIQTFRPVQGRGRRECFEYTHHCICTTHKPYYTAHPPHGTH